MPKTCKNCNVEKELTEFSKSPKNLQGVRSNCKVCDRVRCREWKSKNLDKLKITNDKRTIERRLHQEKEMLIRAKRRATKNDITFNLEISDIVIPKFCPIFGTELKQSENSNPSRNSPSLDRIIPALGYTKENIQIISYKANTMKNDASIDELILFSLWVLENNKLSTENLNRLIELKEKHEPHQG